MKIGRLTCLLTIVASLALTAAAPAGAARAAFAPSPLKHVRANGISIGYRTIGTGPPLVMIMGDSGTLYVWDPGLLARLAVHHKVIVFDNRGVLTTSRGHGRLTISRMADDTAGLIHALGYRRADVLGWSMGGNIAQMLALRHPDVIRRLVLAATDPGGPHAVLPTNPLAVRILNDPNVTNNEVLKVIFPRTHAGVAAKLAYVKRLFRWPNVTESDFNASTTIIREQSIAEGKRLWYCTTCGAYARLPTIRVPTLIADGTQDIIEPTDNSRIIASRIPNETLVLFGSAGHAFLFQFNATFAARVNRFLS